jgi:hypothetical protein
MSNLLTQEEAQEWLHQMHLRIMGDYDGDPWSEHPFQDESNPDFWEDEAKNLLALVSKRDKQVANEARMQATVNAITRFKSDRINHTLSTPASEWERELETADKTLLSILSELEKERTQDER